MKYNAVMKLEADLSALPTLMHLTAKVGVEPNLTGASVCSNGGNVCYAT